MPKKPREKPDWELEHQFDYEASLEELLREPPFREVSGESGESITAGTRIPTWLYRRANKLREMAGSPYEVLSDVFRDAIYLGLRLLNMRFAVSPDWAVESKMASVVDAASTSRRLKRQIAELVGGLEDFWDEGDEGHAITSLTDYIDLAKEIESPWYKKKLFSMLSGDKTIREMLKKCSAQTRKTVEEECGHSDSDA